jgi:hypothetical protein
LEFRSRIAEFLHRWTRMHALHTMDIHMIYYSETACQVVERPTGISQAVPSVVRGLPKLRKSIEVWSDQNGGKSEIEEAYRRSRDALQIQAERARGDRRAR